MRLGYNTNGWRGRPIETIARTLAALGYEAVEITPQPGAFGPASWTAGEARRIKAAVRDAGLVISNLHAGAKDLLSSTPHEPSLISPDAGHRARRFDLNRRAVDFAADLGTDLMCLTSGPLPAGVPASECWLRLTDTLTELLAYASARKVRLALEPEPELFIHSCFGFLDLQHRLGAADELGLNLDIGHAHVVFEDTPAIIRELASVIWHVHVEDIAGRVHRHLVPGQGSIDFHAIGAALAQSGYVGAVSVELMDHSAEAEAVARHCMSVLRTWRRSAGRA